MAAILAWLEVVALLAFAILAMQELGGCGWHLERPKPTWSGVPGIVVPYSDAPPHRSCDGGRLP
jgi:hypothetical protein